MLIKSFKIRNFLDKAALGLLLGILASSRAFADLKPLPSQALSILRMSLETPKAPYEGELVVRTQHGKNQITKHIEIRFSPPGSYRREVVDAFALPILTIVSDGKTQWVYERRKGIAWKGEPADPDYKLLDPDEEYELLTRNYEVYFVGTGTVAGRSCWIVEVRSRENGRLAQRIGVDWEYGLVLERSAYLSDGRESSSLRFTRIQIPALIRDQDFAFSPPRGVRIMPQGLKPDYLALEEAFAASDMKPKTPQWLPPGYIFESANIVPYQGATLLHYRYSNGVGVLSLFQFPRDIRVRLNEQPFIFARPKKISLKSGTARLALLPDGKALEWLSGDRFLLLGDLPVGMLRHVAESLKEQEP